MAKRRRGRHLKDWKTNRADAGVGKLRIVGGKYRGRLIRYSGEAVTRPMKDLTREAIFNLVGGWIKGKSCFDLFAGTGAIGIEAISRGASVAHLVERHFPTAQIIDENIHSIDPQMHAHVHRSDTFFWVREFLATPDTWPSEPWVIFCCPPYALYQERTEDLITLIQTLIEAAPPDSFLIVESNEEFDTSLLPNHQAWNHRHYSPAVISVFRKEPPQSEEAP